MMYNDDFDVNIFLYPYFGLLFDYFEVLYENYYVTIMIC